MKKKLIIILTSLVLIVGLSVSTPISIQAKTAYKTRTVNRYGEFIDTQDAYTPVNLINSFDDGDLLNDPKDMFILDDGTLFIADTGNKRIVVLDEDYNFVRSFGDDLLLKPMGIYIRNNILYVADYELASVVLYTLDGTLIETRGMPSSPILQTDEFIYHPEKIAVDANETMYVVSEGSSDGILQINNHNRFLSFFAPNSVDGTFRDLVLNYFYGDSEEAQIEKKIPVSAHNIMLNDNGYIYTVSQFAVDEGTGDALKKVNIGGENFFSDDMIMDELFEDVWPGNHGNLYAVSQEGFIYEYDSLGNLLFVFAGNNEGTELPGLFSSASAIAISSNDEIIVLDNVKNNIQVFAPTHFVKKVHDALVLYDQGKYEESIGPWTEVLRYNSLFDMAHRGIGLAHMRNENFSDALKEFRISNYKDGYSDAFWEMRNTWLLSNVPYLLLAFILIQVFFIFYNRVIKKQSFYIKTDKKVRNFLDIKLLNELKFLFHYLKNPADAVYEVKRKGRVSLLSACVMVLIMFLLYICYISYTGFLFNAFIIEETILLQEIIKVFVPFITFVLANFLISSLMEGEGSFKSIFIGTVGSLMPVVVFGPFLIVLSNILTTNEEFIYYFLISVMTLYVIIMLFFVVKETHNYTTFQTIINFVLSLLMMIVIILVVIIVYILIFQVYSFVLDIIREVIISG